MKSKIEVRVHGRGSVRDGVPTPDAGIATRCDLCASETDATASVGVDGGGPFACKSCLRERLEAMTLGTWLLREGGEKSGLPWGKISG